MVWYKCKSCKYETFKKSSFVSHFKRKNPCDYKREYSIEEMKIADEFADKFKRENEANILKIQTLTDIDNKLEERKRELQSLNDTIDEREDRIKNINKRLIEFEEKRALKVSEETNRKLNEISAREEQVKKREEQVRVISQKPRPNFVFV